MRRLTIVLWLVFLACRTISFTPLLTPTLSATNTRSATPSPFSIHTSTSTPFWTSGVFPTTTATLPASRSFSVRFHPDGALYVGDIVSLEVIPPAGLDMQGRKVRTEFDTFQGVMSSEEKFSRFGIGGRLQATFQWVWNTAGLTAGEHTITISIQPGGPTWRETIYLFSHGQLPPPEPYARWASVESDCCLVYYITGTSSERDISDLVDVLDEQAEATVQQFGVDLREIVAVTFLPRILGHGGFASQGISMSYLDRNYAGGDLATILHHEMVHILDARLGGELRPTILMEGLAVYLSGGHFKPEVLMPRAAALLPAGEGCVPWNSSLRMNPSTVETVGCGLSKYINFATLVDNFYFEQHETGYLEAGALVEFMVKTWGWKAFSEFYRDIHTPATLSEGVQPKFGDQYRAMNAALVAHFGITLEQLEERFLNALSKEKFTPDNSEDVRLTVFFYETVRRYQQMLDPSAYFLTAWLPDIEQMRKRGIVADYLRRPVKTENLALESMLVSAASYLKHGQYDVVVTTLEAANAVMDNYPSIGNKAFGLHPLAADYLALVEAIKTAGFTPERIQIEDKTARIWVSKSGPMLSELFYVRSQKGWVLKDNAEKQPIGFELYQLLSYGQFHNQLNNVSKGGWQYKSSVSN
jgi:hypothetical protein